MGWRRVQGVAALSLAAAVQLAGSSGSGSSLSFSMEDGIAVNGRRWFRNGNVSVTVGNRTLSAGDGGLVPVGQPVTTSGTDKLGDFSRTAQRWSAGDSPFVTAARVYGDQFIVFEQLWPAGAKDTAVAKGDVSSCWPAIDPTPALGQQFGYVSWQGRFLEASRGGAWQPSSRGGPGPGTGDGSGPFVVFEGDMADSLVFSAASNFMTSTVGQSPADRSFCFGLDAPVASVPTNYSLETLVLLGKGVNSAMKAYGTKLLEKYGTSRPVDYTTQWLGFSTDNGGYYYYGWHTTPEFTNYQTALEGVHQYAKSENIPYKHILLDSWWYTKGVAGGVKEWDATNSTFPDGLKKFAEKTGWTFQMHNRMWSNNNIYAKQNGGKYNFIVEPSPDLDHSTVTSKSADFEVEVQLAGVGSPGSSGLAIPDDQSLWDDLMWNKTSRGIPLRVYEQDWLYNEWQGLEDTRTSPTLSRRWLMQMGAGAAKANVTVQYCMSFARMVLQSVEIPAVTTFRASDDYGPGQTGYYPTQIPGQPPTNGSKGCTFPYCVYYVGTTSILAWALQLGPSKDNFWSKPLQPGSAFNRGPDPWHPGFLNATHEPYNEMQCAISSFTTAQVTPSDGVGFSNASLIKMACRSDGRLLHPSAPARAIDASFALEGGPVPRVDHVHPVMATHTTVAGMIWSHVLVIGLKAPFLLKPEHLGDDFGDGPAVVWTGYQPSDSVGKREPNVTLRSALFTDSSPIEVAPCGYADFGLYRIAPVHPKSGFVFLGELGKWVPVSTARVAAVIDDSGKLSVELYGEPHEQVELAFSRGVKTTEVITTVCTISTEGDATVVFDGKIATCK